MLVDKKVALIAGGAGVNRLGYGTARIMRRHALCTTATMRRCFQSGILCSAAITHRCGGNLPPPDWPNIRPRPANGARW